MMAGDRTIDARLPDYREAYLAFPAGQRGPRINATSQPDHLLGRLMAKVHLSNSRSFEAGTDVSILDAARNSGFVLEHSCRTGRCGTCKAQVISGKTIPIKSDFALSASDKRDGWILTCTTAAVDDVCLNLEDLGLPTNIAVRTLPCRIDSLNRLTPDVMRVMLRLPPNSDFRYRPGQYIDLIISGGARRSYSIANTLSMNGKLELHVRQVAGGELSRYWFEQAKVNDLLRFEGPQGTFFLRDATDLNLIFLATGTGIAPIKAMLAELQEYPPTQMPRSISLYWGGRHKPDLYLDGLALNNHRTYRYIPVLSRAGSESDEGAKRHVQQALLRDRPDFSNSVVYACGSPKMINHARETIIAAGLAKGRFFSDAFVSSN